MNSQEAISKYFRQKAHIAAGDQYHEAIQTQDIWMVKRAFAVMVAAPFASVGLMYLMRAVKQETSMT